MALSLEKIERQAPGLLSLAKKAQTNLAAANLHGQQAKVAICLDFSGSMRSLYANQTVQKVAERVLALATQFDDDGDIDVFLFDTDATYAGTLGLGNYQGGVDRLVRGRAMGRTNYAAVMQLVRKHYAGKKSLFRKAGPADLPAYVLFLTDGAPDSRTDATREIVDASREGIFWQFVGIGGDSFDYLRKLDREVKGRLVDNANFFKIATLESLSDDDLFAKMLAEFPAWILEARRAKLIR